MLIKKIILALVLLPFLILIMVFDLPAYLYWILIFVSFFSNILIEEYEKRKKRNKKY